MTHLRAKLLLEFLGCAEFVENTILAIKYIDKKKKIN